MLKLFGMLLLAIAIALTVEAQPEESILVRVRATDVQYTEFYPADDCVDAGECMPFYFWFKYSARVRESIHGDFSASRVEFANLQHTYFVKRLTRDWLVELVPCGDSVADAVGVEYCVKRHALANDVAGRAALMSAMNEGT